MLHVFVIISSNERDMEFCFKMSSSKLHYFIIITFAEWFGHLKEIEFRFSKNALYQAVLGKKI